MVEEDNLEVVPTGAVYWGEKLYIAFDDVRETFVVKWWGEVNAVERLGGYQKIMEMFCTYKPQKWLFDLQERNSMEKEEQRWVMRYLLPAALKLVQRSIFAAVILPVYTHQAIFAGLGEEYFTVDGNVLRLEQFSYPEESMRWLDSFCL
ncbi:hypothetical protein [Pontibacter harenae]|uniref:hypothetical protein n=1 Tax=Pontibacter harenae TaxID=2894083 RepID=UPI001E38ED7D|nr:hypothetical protein [Pontibacter harenae]MCC9167475.1 hypothetical protein [Pontibacter harenae]